MRTLIILLVLLLVSSPLYAQSRGKKAQRRASSTRLLKIDGKYDYVRGMNLAWLNGCYGHDFGHLPAHPDWGVSFNAADLDKYFADMVRMNINVVRIFVFEALEGLQFDQKGYVKGLDPELVQNFATAVELAKKHGLHLYLCLGIDFHDVCKANQVPDIVCNAKARQAYVNNAIKPFVRRFKGDKGIFAFDVYNEPHYDLKDGNWIIMRNFLAANVTGIHAVDSTRLVSVGAGIDAIRDGYLSQLGLNFYDVHKYGDNGVLPPVAALNVSLPVIVGEFGPNDAPRPPDEDRQAKAVENFLCNARDGGYAGACHWSYEYPDVDPVAHYLTILKGNGSGEWRTAAYRMRDFQWR
jgi:aryl-phospho-beta-D-glucosidase BglC (GH1 family)